MYDVCHVHVQKTCLLSPITQANIQHLHNDYNNDINASKLIEKSCTIYINTAGKFICSLVCIKDTYKFIGKLDYAFIYLAKLNENQQSKRLWISYSQV